MAQELLTSTWETETEDAVLWNRIVERTVITADCWYWTGKPANTGYGQINRNRIVRNPHRIVYEMLVGEIPEGKQLDHLCRNRLCVNPKHLEPVTPKENLLRSPLTVPSINKAKTHCPSGHPYDENNTQTQKDGSRKCKVCSYKRKKAWRKRLQAEGKRYS